MSDASRAGLGRAAWAGIIALGAAAVMVAGLTVMFVFPFGMLLAPVIGVAMAGALVVIAAPGAAVREHAEPPPGAGRRLTVSLPFTVLTLAVVAAGAAHIAVWNPLAKVPGLELHELYRALDAAGESPNWVFLIGWGALWSLAALALPALAVATRQVPAMTDRRIAVLGLLLIPGAAFTSWFAGFNHGMSIADAFMTSGGDAAASGLLIIGFGIVAGIAAAVLALVPRPRRAAEPATANAG